MSDTEVDPTLERLRARHDDLGIYCNLQPGVKVRLPRWVSDNEIEFITGTIVHWEPITAIARGFTWDVTYRLDSQSTDDVISILISPSIPDMAMEEWYMLAETAKTVSMQLVVPEQFYMSVSLAFTLDGPPPENECPIALS